AEQEAAGGPRPIFIPSGGKGGDEPMSEGEAMANYLVARGIPEERIFPETRSVNTKENMRFSSEIAEENCPGGKGAFSTTNYHVFRSGVIAGTQGLEIDGMGSPTKWYFWPNALIREFIGLLVDDLREIVLFSLLIITFCTAIFMIFS
ncbi:MAG: YdcF family protein, partial [Oscillospiraceae bacterium]|nr:YdcF family protein [Oscillospiraceae bacterium]